MRFAPLSAIARQLGPNSSVDIDAEQEHGAGRLGVAGDAHERQAQLEQRLCRSIPGHRVGEFGFVDGRDTFRQTFGRTP